MTRILHYLLFCLFCISACLLARCVAREAIVGGSLARMHQFPYQVIILLGETGIPICGGGILKDQFVLTAAHCLLRQNNELLSRSVFVRAGTIYLYIQNMTIAAQKVYVPKDYNQMTHTTNGIGDIAVLKLKEPLQLQNEDSKLLLPDNNVMLYDHRQTVRIAGFGWDWINGTLQGANKERRLRFADAKVRTLNECIDEHPSIRITGNHICARVMQLQRNAHRGVCNGDGGSPLVLNEKIVIGVLSIPSRGCREKDSSGVYTNIAHYRDFILNAENDDVTEHMRAIDL